MIRKRERGAPGPWGEPEPAERRALADGLGALLREQRQAAGFSQRVLGEVIGSHRGSVAKLERGERRPTEAMLASLAHALCPGDPRASGALYEELARAAGPSLTEATRQGEERRARREQEAERLRRRVNVIIEQADAKLARHRRRRDEDPKGLHTVKPLGVAEVVERLGGEVGEMHRAYEPPAAPPAPKPLPPRPVTLDTDELHAWMCEAARRAGVPRPPHPETIGSMAWWSSYRDAIERVE